MATAPRSNRSSLGALLLLATLLGAAGCASLPPRRPLSPEVEAARAALVARWREFQDLRTQADIRIARKDRVDLLHGVLLLRAPAELRFEALAPFGQPLLVVASNAATVTLWQVADRRAIIAKSSPDATKRWLGLAIGPEELVALFAGYALPPADPRSGDFLPPDTIGPSLAFETTEGPERIWLDPASGETRQVEWSGGPQPARVVFAPEGPTLSALDGSLTVQVRYRDPQRSTGFDPALMPLTVPQDVNIQDFR